MSSRLPRFGDVLLHRREHAYVREVSLRPHQYRDGCEVPRCRAAPKACEFSSGKEWPSSSSGIPARCFDYAGVHRRAALGQRMCRPSGAFPLRSLQRRDVVRTGCRGCIRRPRPVCEATTCCDTTRLDRRRSREMLPAITHSAASPSLPVIAGNRSRRPNISNSTPGTTSGRGSTSAAASRKKAFGSPDSTW